MPITARQQQPATSFGVVATRDELIALGPPRSSSRATSRSRVTTFLAGQHTAKFHGAGMAFSEVRAYQAGDDIRSIDWRVTARTGQMHSKLFEAERERPVWLSVDLGPSMQFATRGTFKSVTAARAASCLAWDAFSAGERVGGVVCAPGRRIEMTPGRTRRHLMRLMNTLAEGTAAPIENAVDDERSLDRNLEWIRSRARTGSRIVVLSDFYQLDETTTGILQALARRCELTLVWIYDPLESEPPPPGRYTIGDGQNDEILIARRSEHWRDSYRQAFSTREDALHRFVRMHGATLIPLRTDTPIERSTHGHGLRDEERRS